jgi:adenosylhomocysteine nucleosidase
MRIIGICGLEAEARLLRKAGIPALVTGGDPKRGKRAAEQAIAQGAEALLSFGIAGGLKPGLAPGDLIVPRTVSSEAGQTYLVEEGLRAAVRRALNKAGIAVARRAQLIGLEAPAATRAAKEALFKDHGASVCDLESLHVARAAYRAKCPFLVLRAVADPAERDLPPAAREGLDAKGRPAYGRVLRSLARNPLQVSALAALARDTRAALKSLFGGLDVVQAVLGGE